MPHPHRDGGVPIIVGGHSEAAAVRAGRFGDGFFPAASPDRLAELFPIMRAAAEETGRDPEAIEITVMGPPPGSGFEEVYENLGVHRIVAPLPTYDPSAIGDKLAEMGAKIGA
jgi:hypothetical protein